MTDSVSSVHVIRIQIGEKLVAQLLANGISINWPNQENPTHQFQITLDPEVKVLLKESIDEPEVPGPDPIDDPPPPKI